MPDAIKLVNVSWDDFKTFQTRDGFNIYYVSHNDGDEVIGISDNFIYHTILAATSEQNDFDTNFKSGATEVDAIDTAIGQENQRETIDVNIVNTVNVGGIHATVPALAADMSYLHAFYDTTSANKETMLTHTVTTGATFYVIAFQVFRAENTNVKGLVTIEVDGSTVMAAHVDTALGGSVIEYAPNIPVPLADEGQVIDVTVDEDGGPGGNLWSVNLIGFEADPTEEI